MSPEDVGERLRKRGLKVLYIDSEILIVNKDPGWVVHRDEHHDESLRSKINRLLSECGPDLEVDYAHRLDKDTSGVIMFVFVSNPAAQFLINELHARKNGNDNWYESTTKVYHAIVSGEFTYSGELFTCLAVDPDNHKKMKVSDYGQEAVSYFRLIHYYAKWNLSLVEIQLLHGRKHQIRAQLAYLGFPIAGDTRYGGVRIAIIDEGDSPETVISFKRQMLHAWEFSLSNSVIKRLPRIRVNAPYPDDIKEVMRKLHAVTGANIAYA